MSPFDVGRLNGGSPIELLNERTGELVTGEQPVAVAQGLKVWIVSLVRLAGMRFDTPGHRGQGAALGRCAGGAPHCIL